MYIVAKLDNALHDLVDADTHEDSAPHRFKLRVISIEPLIDYCSINDCETG